MFSVGSSFLPPQDLDVSEVDSTQATLQWTHPSMRQPLGKSANHLLGFPGFSLDFSRKLPSFCKFLTAINVL